MKVFLVVLSAVLSINTYASTKCDAEPVKLVQVTASGRVVYLTHSGVLRGLGNVTGLGVQQMYEALLLSVEKNLMIQVAYDDGFNCKQENAGANAQWIVLQNVNKL